MERDLYYGIYSDKLLGLREHCTERNCPGIAESTGFLRFNRKLSPRHGWTVEFECPVCHQISYRGNRDHLLLVRDILRPIFDKMAWE